MTDLAISAMGLRLAEEVIQVIKERVTNRDEFRLSFIGHSLGGIVIRSALSGLGMYSKQMYSYMSLGSPHLGYIKTYSALVDTGFWMIRRWKKSIPLMELSQEDAKEPNETFLYRLSGEEGLGWFRNVVLCGSY